MEQIKEILQSILPDVELDGQTALVDDGILNSFEIVRLITELSEAFDIKIRPKHLIPENFNSIEAIWNLVQTILDE
jgi:acyl carrier protein